MEIEGRKLEMPSSYLQPVTYVPAHVKGDASKGEQGVIIRWDDTSVFVLYCKGRTVQRTSPKDLVWG